MVGFGRQEGKQIVNADFLVVGTVKQILDIIVECVDVVKLLRCLAQKWAIFESITEFELYKELIKHVCTILLQEYYTHCIETGRYYNIQLFTDMRLLQ